MSWDLPIRTWQAWLDQDVDPLRSEARGPLDPFDDQVAALLARNPVKAGRFPEPVRPVAVAEASNTGKIPLAPRPMPPDRTPSAPIRLDGKGTRPPPPRPEASGTRPPPLPEGGNTRPPPPPEGGSTRPPPPPPPATHGAAPAVAELSVTLSPSEGADGLEVQLVPPTEAMEAAPAPAPEPEPVPVPPAAAVEGEAGKAAPERRYFIPRLVRKDGGEAPAGEGETVLAPAPEPDDAEDIDASEAEEIPDEGKKTVRPTSRPPPKPKRHWADDVFSEQFAALQRPGAAETARRDVAFLMERAGLRAGTTVLDVGCGDGGHCFELAKQGLKVTGVDNSLAQLLRASQRNESVAAGVTFLHGDMRDLPIDDVFDTVLCLGSSFGYFEEDQNRRCLEVMRDRVKPGGKLVMQVFNRDHLVGHLPARSWWEGTACLVLDEAEMNFFANRLRVHRTVVFEDGRQFEHYMFLRAFTLHDLGKLFSGAGLHVLEVSGHRETPGRFFGASSPDIWIVAERRTENGEI